MSTGVGGPLGLALVSGGADVIIQKATTRKVNWAQAAASTVLGGVGGAAPLLLKATRVGGMATQASLRVAPTANVVKSLAINMGVNGGVVAGMSAIGYGVGSAIDDEEMSDQGFAGAMLGGFVRGVVGGVTGPAGGSIAEHLGKPTSSLISTLASSGVGAADGVSGLAVSNLVARYSNFLGRPSRSCRCGWGHTLCKTWTTNDPDQFRCPQEDAVSAATNVRRCLRELESSEHHSALGFGGNWCKCRFYD